MVNYPSRGQQAPNYWDQQLKAWIEEQIANSPGGGGGGVSDWDDIENKPSTFPPATHTHNQSDVQGLAAALADKADDADLAYKADLEHTHSQADISGLGEALAARVQKVNNVSPDMSGNVTLSVDISNVANAATVASSGSYNDLVDRPTALAATVVLHYNESESTWPDRPAGATTAIWVGGDDNDPPANAELGDLWLKDAVVA